MATAETNRAVKNWLVKSSTKILGPYTREEVIALLSRRQITIIDEIRQPEGRWNYIREHRNFKEIVKNLRYEQDHSREDTMTSTSTIPSQTLTVTMSRTDLTPPEDLTPTPVPPPPAPPPAKPKPAIRDVTPNQDSSAKMVPTSTAATKSYGNLQDQKVRQRIRKQNLWLRMAMFVFVLGALGYIGWTSVHRGEKKVELSYDQLLNAAMRFKVLGLYDQSLSNYKKAAAINEPDLESQFQMAFLLINEDHQSLSGRRIIERAMMKEGRSPQELMQGQLGIALSYMLEGDLNQADDYLQKAMGFDANNESAKINQAIVLLKKGTYPEAFHAFDELGTTGSQNYPLVLLSKAIALIEISKDKPNTELLQKLAAEMRVFMSKSHFLRKELALLLISTYQAASDSSGALDAINLFMEEPQGLSHQYVRDLALDWRSADWDTLDKYCNDVVAKGPASIKAVRAVCLLESNRDLEASKLIDEALAQSPKQINNLEAQAQYMWKLGREKEALTLFQTPEAKNNKLVLYLQGDNCLKGKDFACSQTAYKTLLDRDSGDVEAHYGMALTQLGKGDKVKAQAEVKAGFDVENNFIPLIELREKLETP